MGRPVRGQNSSEESEIVDFERKVLTQRLKYASDKVEEYLNRLKEVNERSMSKDWKQEVCDTCGGHGEVDGEPCPECGGLGLSEPTDERIYPDSKWKKKSRKVPQESG